MYPKGIFEIVFMTKMRKLRRAKRGIATREARGGKRRCERESINPPIINGTISPEASMVDSGPTHEKLLNTNQQIGAVQNSIIQDSRKI